MSSRRSISNTFTVTTMDDPVSVEAQYSPDKSTIHSVWQDGDLYMRTRESDSSVWSSWHLIVGENGDETDFRFAISSQKTTASASTSPSDIGTNDWVDAPVAITSAKPYLWARVQQKSWNASTQSYVVDSTRYIRLTGEDGYSVEAQYAPNSNPTSPQIHTVWQSGDLYMRTKKTNETSWSSWHKIVGENGKETDYSFNISKEKTSASATTSPPNCYYDTWQDTPISPTSTYPYLWMKIQKKDGNGNNIGDASYARVTGELGIDYEIRCDIDSIKIPKDTTSTSVSITFNFYSKESGGAPIAYNAYYGIYYRIGTDYTRITTGSGSSASSASLSDYSIDNTKTAIVVFMFSSSYRGNNPMSQSYLAKLELPIYKDGDTGTRGKTGRFYYYAQEWSNSSYVSYTVTDAEAPYFLYNGNYWVFNPTNNGTYTMSAMGTPSSSNVNWELMVTDFKFIITEAIFGSYAHFGSAIINGDWLLSTHGKRYGSDSTEYTYFDASDPMGVNSQSHFAPNFCVDLKTGESYQKRVYTSGGMRSPFSYLTQYGTFTEKLSDNIGVYSTSANSGTNYYIPCDVSQSGRKICVTNYYFNGQSSVGSGWATLNMSNRGRNQYFFEDGIMKTTLKLSREGVELLGYGNETTFYGWIVIKRFDLGTVSRYGHNMKMLAVANVNVTKSGTTPSANISYHSFDGTTLSVTRNSVGNYTVSWDNSNWFANANSVFVMICGLGTTVDAGDNAVYASVKSKTSTSFVAQVADDNTLNDGSFSFFLMNFDDWVYLH